MKTIERVNIPDDAILGFNGPYKFLSNFVICLIKYEGMSYPTTEHAYQASKTLVVELRQKIQEISKPGWAKAAGNSSWMQENKRPDWNDVRYDIMLDILRLKFQQEKYKKLLLETGDRMLIELNTWNDTNYGMVEDANGDFVGDNHLGELLMQVRNEHNSSQSQAFR